MDVIITASIIAANKFNIHKPTPQETVLFSAVVLHKAKIIFQ